MEKNEIDLVAEQVSRTLADHRIIDIELKAKITHMIVETSMSSYREGFHNGGASNGGFNRGIKQVMRYWDLKGERPRYENDLSDIKRIQDTLGKLQGHKMLCEDGVLDNNIETVLFHMVMMQINIFAILCRTGMSDIFTAAFDEIINCDLQNATLGDADPEKYKQYDLASIIKQKNDLVALMKENNKLKTDKTEVTGDTSDTKK